MMQFLPVSTGRFCRWPKTPRPAGCKKLKGYKDVWRIRAGNWRVIYVIDDSAKRVIITRVAHRREVYDT
jgi:mRNA interferase RelE/StbE